MKASRRQWATATVLFLALALSIVMMQVWMHLQQAEPVEERPLADLLTPQMAERGAYLVRAGNCAACHTARGGQPFAGGRGIETPFGTVFSSNITPEKQTGIGTWSAADFWRSMHHGRSKDGRLLYPAFPYTEYTRLTRDDSDAMFAYLRNVQAVQQTNQPHTLRFPYSTQAALAVWRMMFFSPDTYAPVKEQTEQWNRGAYLVTVLGHCQACHSPRNLLGAIKSNAQLAGGAIPMQNWYAPSLLSPVEGGVQDWPSDEIIQWLRAGKTAKHSALGPMAEVVFNSTQYLTDTDLSAMAAFLKALPRQDPPKQTHKLPDAEDLQTGERLYQNQCAQCHGDNGEGNDIYPAMAGNRTVTLNSSVNLLRVILIGGFTPATQANPRPYGMPPFGHALSDAQIAALATYMRNAWGNDAGVVMPVHVQKLR